MNATGSDLKSSTASAEYHRAGREVIRLHWILLRLGVVTVAAGGVLIEHGFFRPVFDETMLHLVQLVLLGVYYIDLISRGLKKQFSMPGQQLTWFDFVLTAVVVIAGTVHFFVLKRYLWCVVEVVIILLFLTETWRFQVAYTRRVARPGLLFPLSFLTLIVLGTLIIKLPVATSHTIDPSTGEIEQTAASLSWLDAAFTMTSAVCVTGLTVRSTADQFSPFGQMVIVLFIQLGGLGMIIFGSVLAMLIGRRFSLSDSMNMSRMLNDIPLSHIRVFVRFIVTTTIVIELIGAAALYPLWDHAGNITVSHRIGLSLFHSISAFCNAGFDITGDSLLPYRRSLLAHGVVLPLLVVGGLGFPVLENIFQVIRTRVVGLLGRTGNRTAGRAVDLSKSRLNLHSKLVLTTSLVLFVYGFIVIGGGQLVSHLRSGETFGLGLAGRMFADAGFMSLTSRTAGFNTMPISEIEPAGRFCLMSLMFIGGSPGSTAGGVKTTVLALLVLSVAATLRQRKETEAFGRSIPDTLVRRAAALGICYFGLIVISTILLSCSESFSFEAVLFEVVSASATTGLSLGITDDLTTFGRAVLIPTMFLGRIGPLALIAAITFRQGVRRPYAYPHETVGLG